MTINIDLNILERMSMNMNSHNLNNFIKGYEIILEDGNILDFKADSNILDRYNYSQEEKNCYIFLNSNKSKAETQVVDFFDSLYKQKIIETIGLNMFKENQYYFMWENNLDFGLENKRKLCIEHFKIKYDDNIQKFVMFNDFMCYGCFSKNYNLRINFIFNIKDIDVEILIFSKEKILSSFKNKIKHNQSLNHWFEKIILPYGITFKGAETIGLNSLQDYSEDHYELYKLVAY